MKENFPIENKLIKGRFLETGLRFSWKKSVENIQRTWVWSELPKRKWGDDEGVVGKGVVRRGRR